MFRKILAALSSLALFSGAAFSQVSCDAEKVSALVDTYASNPFSARTWRVLNGLGDPMIEPSQSGPIAGTISKNGRRWLPDFCRRGRRRKKWDMSAALDILCKSCSRA